MTDHSEPLFSIQQISRKLNLPKSTLRFWEKELEGIIVPVRTAGGQRRYGVSDLTILYQVKRFRDKGMSLLEIKSHLQRGNRSVADDPRLGNIDLLAERVAEVIKTEVYKFLSNHTLTDIK